MLNNKKFLLNGICPYFTMFPLDFPYSILSQNALAKEWVLDPFCGRGTTNYASRVLGLPSIGIDNSPVAVALSQAKLANTSPNMIMQEAFQMLEEVPIALDVPIGEFWDWAFQKDVLQIICRFREGFLKNCVSDTRKALRALIMGALHGPQLKGRPSYFSNQSQRTYAPKPGYAVKFWKSRSLAPQKVDVLQIIEARAIRYYLQENMNAIGTIVYGDSREESTYIDFSLERKIGWVITSPPYYGMRTYIPDQWLRAWFLGGLAIVDYSASGQVSHASPEIFASQLKKVWVNAGKLCIPEARLVIRFGAINERRVDSLSLLKLSLQDSGWAVTNVESAGFASEGRRQALHFSHNSKEAMEEHDVWAVWQSS